MEIKSAINKLKNYKSPGPDGLPAEFYKCGTNALAPVIKAQTDIIWREGRIPNSWKNGTIIVLPKKGNLSECKNWRGITLLNTIIKILAIVIHDRLLPVVDELLRPEQAGFRKNRSCTDHVNTLRIIVEQSVEWQAKLYLLFVDFERAFDTIHRTAIWSALANLGIPDKITNIIKEMYNDAKYHVRFAGDESNSFEINRGVRQGCVLSPMLFLIVLDSVMNEVNSATTDGIQWTINTRLNDLDYADDIVLLSHTYNGIEEKLRKLDEIANRAGLKINVNKTKTMRINVSTIAPLIRVGLDNSLGFFYAFFWVFLPLKN